MINTSNYSVWCTIAVFITSQWLPGYGKKKPEVMGFGQWTRKSYRIWRLELNWIISTSKVTFNRYIYRIEQFCPYAARNCYAFSCIYNHLLGIKLTWTRPELFPKLEFCVQTRNIYMHSMYNRSPTITWTAIWTWPNSYPEALSENSRNLCIICVYPLSLLEIYDAVWL